MMDRLLKLTDDVYVNIRYVQAIGPVDSPVAGKHRAAVILYGGRQYIVDERAGALARRLQACVSQ